MEDLIRSLGSRKDAKRFSIQGSICESHRECENTEIRYAHGGFRHLTLPVIPTTAEESIYSKPHSAI
jgi:hypothetical protein